MGKPDDTLIFVVEDDDLYANVLQHSLAAKNFVNVKVFRSGEECLKQMHLKPVVILLDFRLGEGNMNGLEVLKAIKKTGNNSQVVFLTAVDQLEVATQTIKEGAYDYVVKSEAAIERVRNILRRITFENHIKRENLVLRRSRKIIIGVILVLLLGIAVLGFLQFGR